jgi:hypothetical protein
MIRAVMTGSAALCLAVVTAAASAQPGDNNVPIIGPLIGRTLPQVVAQFGKPIEAIPLRETGGKLLIFESSHGDRYIIETDVSNHVVEAAVKHPRLP